MATVDISGPFFGDRDAITEAGMRQAKYDVAAQGRSYWGLYLDAYIRNPTPYYETQITTEWQGETRVVHDRGIVYGPWLEGTSSRNSTTRFRGYGSRRKAVAQLQGDVPRLVENAVDTIVHRLGD